MNTRRQFLLTVFHNNLGIALERTGQYTMATQAYRAGLSVDSTYKKASSLARVEQRVDDPSVSPIDLAWR